MENIRKKLKNMCAIVSTSFFLFLCLSLFLSQACTQADLWSLDSPCEFFLLMNPTFIYTVPKLCIS